VKKTDEQEGDEEAEAVNITGSAQGAQRRE
jgi:hypothetical protein